MYKRSLYLGPEWLYLILNTFCSSPTKRNSNQPNFARIENRDLDSRDRLFSHQGPLKIRGSAFSVGFFKIIDHRRFQRRKATLAEIEILLSLYGLFTRWSIGSTWLANVLE